MAMSTRTAARTITPERVVFCFVGVFERMYQTLPRASVFGLALVLSLCGACEEKPAPAQPAPTQPAPTQPAPTQPAPAQPAPAQPATQTTKLPSALVEPPWLLANRAGVVVIDSRSPTDYAAGHIEGAIHLDLSGLDADAAADTKDVRDEATVAKVLGAAGLDTKTPVVIYGTAADYRTAARLFWILELHSHPAAAVLNGGFEGWIAAGGPTSTTPHTRPPSVYTGARIPGRIADSAEVLAASQAKTTTLIDARSPSDFSGQTAPSAMTRRGHIPNAQSLDVSSTYIQEGGIQRLPAPDALQSLYQDIVPQDGNVITYCNGGRSASLTYLELRAAGHQNVSLYDGSWGEWSSSPTLPLDASPK